MGANSFLLGLSDSRLAAINAEDLDFRGKREVEAFFYLKVRKNLISTEMIVAALDGELSPELTEEIRKTAMRSVETARQYKDFESLVFKFEKAQEQSKTKDFAELTANQPKDVQNILFSKRALPEQASLDATIYSTDNGDDFTNSPLSWAPSGQLRKKLAELKKKETNKKTLGRAWQILITYLYDLTTPRVGGTAFASLLVGIFSTSLLFQVSNTITFEAPTDRLVEFNATTDRLELNPNPGISTRGPATDAIQNIELLNQSSGGTLANSRPALLQNGNTILAGGGVVLENTPWSVSARSMINGTASLSALNENGEYSLLDTEPAYQSLFFTFNSFEVAEQDQLVLRVTVENEEISMSFQLEYSVAP